MRECFAIVNQKGGVAKSTTAAAIAAGLLLKGYKVLVVDLDAQGNLSYSYDAKGESWQNSLALMTEALIDDTERLIVHTRQGDIVPSTPQLANAEQLLPAVGTEQKLKEGLQHLTTLYDYIVIDTPPALGALTTNALTACTKAIIPTQADVYGLQGIGGIQQTIEAVRKYCNPQLKVEGILLTRYNGRTTLSRDTRLIMEETAKVFNTKLFNTPIRECIAVKEAQMLKRSIFEYAPKCNAAGDYRALIEELLA